jgi:hypothetical protein
VRQIFIGIAFVVSLVLLITAAYATVRTTDPPRNATEQFLMSKGSSAWSCRHAGFFLEFRVYRVGYGGARSTEVGLPQTD